METALKRVKTGGRKAGTLNKKTEISQSLGIENFQELTEKIILNYLEMLNSEDDNLRMFAMKELSKIIFKNENVIKYHAKTMFHESQYDFDL